MFTMGQFYETIPESLVKWILAQKVFWVATAPLSPEGHVNVSPKGGPYFGILDTKTFWYLDLSGSGNETISHLYEKNNGRITVMFNAFEGPPRIVRLFGHGTVLENGTDSFNTFVKKHEVRLLPGARSIILVHVHQVGSSCGFSVPYFEFKDWRTTLNEFFARKADRFDKGDSKESIEKYWALKNSESVDGLPGLDIARKTAKEDGIVPLTKMVGAGATHGGQRTRKQLSFGVLHLALVAVIASFATVFLQPVFGELLKSLESTFQH